MFKKSPVRKFELWLLLKGTVWLLFSVMKPKFGSAVGTEGDISRPPNKSNKSWLLLLDMGWLGAFIISKSERSVPPNKSNRAF